MKIEARTYHDILKLHEMIKEFLVEFEEIYVGGNPENISRCRLCIFQLIHVPMHIEWYGSICLGSQSTVERTIGEMGRQIRSKKAPFSHLGNLIFERELLKILLLYYPELNLKKPEIKKYSLRPFSEKRIKRAELNDHTSLAHHISVLCAWVGKPYDLKIPLKRWSKLQLENGNVLSSLSLENQPDRVSNFFEAKGLVPVFGHAIGFFQVAGNTQTLVLFHELANTTFELNRWGGQWSNDVSVILASNIVSLVSVLVWDQHKICILRYHPALSFLNDEDKGIQTTESQ